MADTHGSSWTGMSDDEAQEFHTYYLQGMVMFVIVAVVAHLLVWLWRPWIPGPEGYASLMDSVNSTASAVLPFLA